MSDARLHYPATARNREAILAVLRATLPARGRVLEIASGSGEHVVHFARGLPELTFLPSDPAPAARASIAAWAADAGLANVRAPVALDVGERPWPVDRADAILCINMIHVAPPAAAEALIDGAAAVLAPGGPLYLYGPFRRKGLPWAESNERFDRALRAENPAWGVRDLDAVSALARAAGFEGPVVTEMPANNLSVVYRRA
ncbi:MAG: DUF938 domain-containing protein [Alphaproteobacteria bacterium]